MNFRSVFYKFGSNKAKGASIPTHNMSDKELRKLLGGKGASLVQMSSLGLNVPAGFTISTEICSYYYNNGRSLPDDFEDALAKSILELESASTNNNTKKFGGKNPLLLSIRSGAQESMPGMMDTILNLGLNDETVEYLGEESGDMIFALDSYRRLIQMYGTTIFSIPHAVFEEILENYKESPNEKDLRLIVRKFKDLTLDESGMPFPQDVWAQLNGAVRAVLNSWMSDRAVIYRKLHDIKDTIGTAVTVQNMVFGNKGSNSGSGVVFSRNPSTGENKLFGEYIINAQGEDIVSGTRTPHNIESSNSESPSGQALSYVMPEIYYELKKQVHLLEAHYKDAQDIEFTIEEGKLYILQTRAAKRTTTAAIKIAVDMVQESIISKEEAIMRISPDSINNLLHARIDETDTYEVLANGIAASPGASVGIAVFSPYDAEELSHHHKVILVRNDTSPEDIKGMHVASGILTVRGGMTSHAAVVARGMGKPCVCGTNGIFVNEAEKFLKVGDIIIRQGEELTIDGSTGKIFAGAIKLLPPVITPEFNLFMKWVDDIKHLKVRANAETAEDAQAAIALGAEGIGLCRTEHMFFREDKVALIREMIISPNIDQRTNAIKKLLPIHKNDFKDIFRVMNGMPVNIRLLDPPLHEFLPQNDHEKRLLAKSIGLPWSVVENRLHALHEVNPMLGHRGCRLGVTFPEIYEMQVEAIFSAISELKKEQIEVDLEIMMPLISDVSELCLMKALVMRIAKEVEVNTGCKIPYLLGTMIELPRAALKAGEIAKEADYFSFGTNDLTQTTFGISRDDIASFMPEYIAKGLLKNDPFVTIDIDGVGELIRISIERGRKTNPKLKLGICGEHGGDPKSIIFCHNLGMEYVSCSPYRIPIARIAAAQASLQIRE